MTEGRRRHECCRQAIKEGLAQLSDALIPQLRSWTGALQGLHEHPAGCISYSLEHGTILCSAG
jgi:hypothetical protein